MNLAQRILERLHIPQADILQCELIVCRIGCIDSRLGRKLAQQEAVKAVGLLRHLDVMQNVRLLAHQFVWLDQKTGYIPAHQPHHGITKHGRDQRCNQPAPTRSIHACRCGNHRPKHERNAHHEQTGERHMRIGVSDAVEDCMVIE